MIANVIAKAGETQGLRTVLSIVVIFTYPHSKSGVIISTYHHSKSGFLQMAKNFAHMWGQRSSRGHLGLLTFWPVMYFHETWT